MWVGAGQVRSIGLMGNHQKWPKINENQWKSMEINENSWFLMIFKTYLSYKYVHPTPSRPPPCAQTALACSRDARYDSGWHIMRVGVGQVGSIALMGNHQKCPKMTANQWKFMIFYDFQILFILQIYVHPTYYTHDISTTIANRPW